MKIFIVIVFILYIPFLFAEDLIMELKPNPLGRGDKFTVELYLDYSDIAGIKVEPPLLPGGIRFFKGPYMRPYWMESKNGETRKKTLVIYTYSTSKTGRFIMAPFIVTLGEKIIETNPMIVRVGLYKNRKLFIPYDLKWVVGSGPYFEGMAIPLLLEVRNLEEVMPFENITVSNLVKGLSEPLRDAGEISETIVGDASLYTVPVAGIVFTPTSIGRIKLPSASVVARGIKSVTESSYLSVSPLPDSIKSTGAVGNFTISKWIENKEPRRNEKIIIHIKATGNGNLNYLQIPLPSGPGLTLVGTEDISSYETTIGGFSGFREVVISFISDSAGSGILQVPPFPYYNPDTGEVDNGSSSEISFTIAADSSKNSDMEVEDLFPFAPGKLGSERFSSKSRYKDPSSYLWLLPGPLVFLIFLLTGRKKNIIVTSIFLIVVSGTVADSSLLNNGIEKYESGAFSEALGLLRKAQDEDPGNQHISYNLSLSYYQTGEMGYAIYEARNAFYHDPLNKNYRDLIEYLEEKQGITFPVEPSFNLYPDLFLFLLMIFVNMAAFAGVVYLIKNRNFFFILSILLLSLSVLSFGGLVFSILQKDRMVGVVTGNAISVKKIPSDNSESIINLKSGESAIINGNSDNYLFITTGTGIKGWVQNTDLMLVED
ncbi:MAG: hypothetical protein L3J12_01085 [Spirochaetales bacterium]|nr:hypothetical protein [Spirochaetales bacterium]